MSKMAELTQDQRVDKEAASESLKEIAKVSESIGEIIDGVRKKIHTAS